VQKHVKEKMFSLTNGAWTSRHPHIDLYLSPCVKTNSKWIKDHNVSYKILKPLQESIEKALEDIGTDNDFLNKTLITQEIGTMINKRDCIKLESFAHQRKQLPE
jgi:hypothetical protein